jgi:hypothetical protein
MSPICRTQAPRRLELIAFCSVRITKRYSFRLMLISEERCFPMKWLTRTFHLIYIDWINDLRIQFVALSYGSPSEIQVQTLAGYTLYRYVVCVFLSLHSVCVLSPMKETLSVPLFSICTVGSRYDFSVD